jgi:hypothetical protein
MVMAAVFALGRGGRRSLLIVLHARTHACISAALWVGRSWCAARALPLGPCALLMPLCVYTAHAHACRRRALQEGGVTVNPKTTGGRNAIYRVAVEAAAKAAQVRKRVCARTPSPDSRAGGGGGCGAGRTSVAHAPVSHA